MDLSGHGSGAGIEEQHIWLEIARTVQGEAWMSEFTLTSDGCMY